MLRSVGAKQVKLNATIGVKAAPAAGPSGASPEPAPAAGADSAAKPDEAPAEKPAKLDVHSVWIDGNASVRTSLTARRVWVPARTLATPIARSVPEYPFVLPAAVAKQHCVFTFAVDKRVFTLYGNAFRSRPSERSFRRWKLRTSIDI